MPEVTRSILARLRKFIGDRRRAVRRPIRLSCALSLLSETPKNGSRTPPSIEGHTLDIGAAGLALIVPEIRIGDHYLTESRGLQLKLELPSGPIEIKCVSVRYQSLDEEESAAGYLIGVSITEMSEEDRVLYNELLATLLKK